MALVTLSEYKTAIKEASAANDAFHQGALDAAQDAVLNYADRDFGAPPVTETRTYLYDGSGVLNIDDASTVTAVTLESVLPLTTNVWRARHEGPASVVAYSWLELPQIDLSARRNSLGVMGFTQNLDRFLTSNGLPEITAAVTASWGWATVPNDVKRAVIWTAEAYEAISGSSGSAGGVASRSVAEVAESYFAEAQAQQGTPPSEAVPPRAQAILDAYRRVSIH
jgi:hypothetical protein